MLIAKESEEMKPQINADERRLIASSEEIIRADFEVCSIIGGYEEDWVKMKIENLVLKTKLKDPNKHPDATFKYIDVSGVSNTLFKIENYSILFGREAPSRARKLINFQDIIFATVRPTLMRIALVPQELDGEVCSTGYCVLKPNQEKIVPQFLYYSVLTDFFIEKISKLQTGASYPAIRDSDLKNQIINIPSLPEQRKIAHVLSTMQKAIEQQDNLIRTTTELKKALMQKLFTEGTRGEPQKQTEIGLVPKSWETIKIGELGKCITGTTPKTKVEEYWINPEYDFIAPADIGNTKYVYNSEKQISEAGLGVSRILPKNSVMCVCIGSSIGKVGLTIKEKSSTNQQINSIICNSVFNPVYIYYLLSQISEYWKGHATFGPVPILNKGQFEQIEIAVTKDTDEQNEIANSISVLDLKIEFHDMKKRTLTALFKTLLHELMTGQRRVHEVEFK